MLQFPPHKQKQTPVEIQYNNFKKNILIKY